MAIYCTITPPIQALPHGRTSSLLITRVLIGNPANFKSKFLVSQFWHVAKSNSLLSGRTIHLRLLRSSVLAHLKFSHFQIQIPKSKPTSGGRVLHRLAIHVDEECHLCQLHPRGCRLQCAHSTGQALPDSQSKSKHLFWQPLSATGMPIHLANGDCIESMHMDLVDNFLMGFNKCCAHDSATGIVFNFFSVP